MCWALESALEWARKESTEFPRIPFYQHVRARVAEHEGWLVEMLTTPMMLGQGGKGGQRRGRARQGPKSHAKGADDKGLRGRNRSRSPRVGAEQRQVARSQRMGEEDEEEARSQRRGEEGEEEDEEEARSKRMGEEGEEEEEEEEGEEDDRQEEEEEGTGYPRLFADQATMDGFLALASVCSDKVRKYLEAKAAKHAAEAAEAETSEAEEQPAEEGEGQEDLTEEENEENEEAAYEGEGQDYQLGEGEEENEEKEEGEGEDEEEDQQLGSRGRGQAGAFGRAPGRLARSCPFVRFDLADLAQGLGVHMSVPVHHLLRVAEDLGVDSPTVLLDLLRVALFDMPAVLTVIGKANRRATNIDDMNRFVGTRMSVLAGNLTQAISAFQHAH